MPKGTLLLDERIIIVMKNIKKIPLLIIIAVTAVVFTIVGLLGMNLGYAAYAADFPGMPALSMVMRGFHDGVTPVEALAAKAKPVQDNAGSPDSADAAEGATEASTAAETAEEAAEAGGTQEQSVSAADLNIPDGVNSPVVDAEDFGNTDKRMLAPAGTVFKRETSGIFAPNGTYYYLQSVDDSYFDDALFIGDSRTDGLHIYGNMAGKAAFLCKESMSVFHIFDEKMPFFAKDNTSVDSEDAQQMLMTDVLKENQYRKIYVSVGVNELGMPTTVEYYKAYKKMLEEIHKLQPDAIIYIEGIMHVTAEYARSSSVFTNTNIVERNNAIASLANGRDIFYIDMNDEVCDENGNLIASLSGDGVHLKASAYARWHQFLLDNAIVRNEKDWSGAGSASEGGTS